MMRRNIFAILAIVGLSVAACGDNETPPSKLGNYVGATPAGLSCLPNLDGKIDANELAPAIGVTANYITSPANQTRPVDLVGGQQDGKTTWTFNQTDPDAKLAAIVAVPLKGKWYESSFADLPDAFVIPVDAGDTSEGVYTHDSVSFALHGVASTQDGANKTLLVYTTPIALYQFPLTVGLNYTVTGEITNGTFQGLPFAGRTTYEVKVTAAGEVLLPQYDIQQALKVTTKITNEPSAGITTITRQTSFLTECIGEVVRATSQLGEPNEDFTTAAEIRRLGLGQ